MTDISQIVQYDRAVEVALEINGTPVGITFSVRHIDCDRATEVGREFDDGDKTGDRMTAVLAACIASWDWGEHDWKGEVPEYSEAKALEVITEARWMITQIAKVAGDLGNFTSA